MCKIRNGDGMKIKFNIDKIKHLFKDISVLTGISISLIDNTYKGIADCKNTENFCGYFQRSEAYNFECLHSDRKVLDKCIKSGKIESHICHAGLCDLAMPLVKNGITVGYILMGQIRCQESPENFIGRDDLKELYKKTAFLNEQQIESLKNLLPQILFNDAIDFEYESIIDEIAEYINANLQKDLSIATLCKKFNVSKNCLYNGFRGKFSTTVNEYISSVRIAKAKELLKKTNSTVYVIAETVGIENYTYFCKLFKNTVGISPSKYRVS